MVNEGGGTQEKSTADFFAVFKPGQYVFKEGQPGKSMYIIEEGEVEIVRGAGSDERQLARLEHGDFFGEMAILDQQPRGASARALTDCRLLEIDAALFDQMLRENPEIAVRMMRKLSRRLRAALAASEGEGAAPRPAATQQPAAPPAIPPAAPAERAPAPAEAPPAAPEPAAAAPVSEPSAIVPSPADGGTPAEPAPVAPPQSLRTPLRARLVGTGGEFVLPDGDATVGRFDSSTGIAPDVDLAAIDVQRTTSRRHARIVREDDRFYLFEEVGTANGTFINGERIETGVRAEFKPGDEVRFGTVSFRFETH
jgi:hypothetical protein